MRIGLRKTTQSKCFKLLFISSFFMSSKYPKELINEMISYFKDRRDLDISEDEAEEFLNSLAEFYDSFQSMI